MKIPNKQKGDDVNIKDWDIKYKEKPWGVKWRGRMKFSAVEYVTGD